MINDYHISILQMMENAGRLLARFVFARKPQHISILVGPGHNGGGGLVAARYLHNYGITVTIVLAQELTRIIPQNHLRTARKLNIPIVKEIPEETDIVVDALLGYNAKGQPHGNIASLLQKITTPTISLDVPTGLDLRTGNFYQTACKDAIVLTLGLPKKNMEKVKELYVADIGIPQEVYKKVGIIVEDVFKGKEIIKAR
jgi:NAD(P)H-hydrate epimerase